MDEQPTLQTIVAGTLSHLDLGATTTPLPDRFGADYKALHNYYLEALAAEVSAVPEITSKAVREASQKTRTRLVRIRTGLDGARKAMFAPMRALKEEVDAYMGTTPNDGLQGRVKALERILEEKEAKWDAEQERIRQEAQAKVDERNRARAKRIVDAGMVFDGASFKLMDVMVYPTDLNRLKDEEFEEWFTGVLGPAVMAKQDADRLAQEEERAEAERRAAKEAAAKEEHDRMQAEFRRQAEVQRKQDEERAAIDAERARLKAEKQRVRHERLIALGAEYDGRGIYHVGGDLCQVPGNLADLKDEDWIMAQEAVPRAKERWDAICAEKMRMNKQTVARGETLAILGAERDETGTWTLGNATTTHHLLREMSAEDWNATLTKFEAEAEADELPISTAPDEADLRELLACSLSLLDEANKAFTTHGNDVRYSEALAKVQAHAGDCVRITRELQSAEA